MAIVNDVDKEIWKCGCVRLLGTIGCRICERCHEHCLCGTFKDATRAKGDNATIHKTKCSLCGKTHTCIY